MRFTNQAILLLLTSCAAFACAATTDGDDADGGDGDGTGGMTSSIGGTTGMGTGGTTGSTGGTTGAGTGGATSVACTTLMAGAGTDDGLFWAGDSTGTATITGPMTGSIGLANASTSPVDSWASLSYAFTEGGTCVNGTALTSVTFDVTTTSAQQIRAAISIPATTPAAEGGSCAPADCSNHYSQTLTFAGAETKSVTLNFDGSGLMQAWAGGSAAWSAASMLQVSVSVLPASGAVDTALPAYDVTISNVTVQ